MVGALEINKTIGLMEVCDMVMGILYSKEKWGGFELFLRVKSKGLLIKSVHTEGLFAVSTPRSEQM